MSIAGIEAMRHAKARRDVTTSYQIGASLIKRIAHQGSIKSSNEGKRKAVAVRLDTSNLPAIYQAVTVERQAVESIHHEIVFDVGDAQSFVYAEEIRNGKRPGSGQAAQAGIGIAWIDAFGEQVRQTP